MDTTATTMQPQTEHVSRSQTQLHGQANPQLPLLHSVVPGHGPYNYLQLLSRITSCVTSLSTTTEAEMSDHSYHDVLNLLLQQPLEIRHLIFGWLEPRDLLNLRMTDRTWHNQVHASEQPICMDFADHLTKLNDLTNVPIRVHSFSSLCQISNRYVSLCDLAKVLADQVGSRLTVKDRSDTKDILEQWRRKKVRRLERKLLRALLILQQYLDLFQEIIIKNERLLEALPDSDYISLHNIFDLDQQQTLSEHMSGLSENDFTDVTAVFGIFKSICKARNLPFHLKVHTFPFASVRQILVHKGLAPFGKLLAPDCSQTQQDTILRSLSQDIASLRRLPRLVQERLTLGSIHHIDGYAQSKELRFDMKRSSKPRDIFISHQDIWDRSARALMMSKLGRFPAIPGYVRWISEVITEGEERVEILPGPWDAIER